MGLPLLLLWLLRMRSRVRVSGESMEPVLSDGDEILVQPMRSLSPQALKPGDIVWLQHPLRSDTTLVKRLLKVEPNGFLYVQGDQARASSDSRVFGAVPPSKLLGRVVARF